MPKQVHAHPGIKPLSGNGYQARVSFKGFEESQNFRLLEDAKRWQRNLRQELERAPEGVRRKKKQWHASVIGPEGVTTETFDSLADAIQWRNEADAHIRRGEPVRQQRPAVSFHDYATSWLDRSYADEKARKGTYASQLRLHVLPHLGGLDLQDISSETLQGWINRLEDLKVGIPTIRGAASAVRMILKKAHKERLIATNPWDSIDVPTGKRSKRARAFTEEQLFAIAALCGEYEFLVIFLGHCGLRIGEATALTRGHIDLERNVIRVEQAWGRTRSGKRILGPTKTGESRSVPIPRRIRAELKKVCSNLSPEDYLFVGAKGEPLNPEFFRKRWFTPAAKAIGIRDAYVHMLRHTCASILIRVLTPITAVSHILGHSSVEVTLNTYAHFYEEDVFKAMDNLSNHYDRFTE